VDRLKETLKIAPAPAAAAAAPKSRPAKTEADPFTCPHCNARFEKELKFCGECGKPMKAVNV
jgi:hypothetical protein